MSDSCMVCGEVREAKVGAIAHPEFYVCTQCVENARNHIELSGIAARATARAVEEREAKEAAEQRARDAEAKAERMREALKFYADEKNYQSGRPGRYVYAREEYDEWREDNGVRAREALAEPSAGRVVLHRTPDGVWTKTFEAEPSAEKGATCSPNSSPS